jgi:hypothetical protein
VERCRKLGGGILSNDAQAFFLEKCLNDEVNMAFHLLLCSIISPCSYALFSFSLSFPEKVLDANA